MEQTQGGSVPLDQQRCERTHPKTGLMEQLPALVCKLVVVVKEIGHKFHFHIYHAFTFADVMMM